MSSRPKRKAVNDGRDLYAFDPMRGSDQPNVEKGKDDYKAKHVERVFTEFLKGTYFVHVRGSTFDPYDFVAVGQNNPSCTFRFCLSSFRFDFRCMRRQKWQGSPRKISNLRRYALQRLEYGGSAHRGQPWC